MANVSKSETAAAMREEGVGISQRSSRWRMSMKLIEQVCELVSYCCARSIIGCIGRVAGDKIKAPRWSVMSIPLGFRHLLCVYCQAEHARDYFLKAYRVRPCG